MAKKIKNLAQTLFAQQDDILEVSSKKKNVLTGDDKKSSIEQIELLVVSCLPILLRGV